MPTSSREREIAIAIKDVARLLTTYADHKSRQLGMTRAQWVVLSRIQHFEGLKQSELAEMCDLQPISLARLVDKLCDSGLIERRPDPNDRRAKRLFLKPAAEPILKTLIDVGNDMMEIVLAGVAPDERDGLLANLLTLKTNLRGAIAHRADDAAAEQRYG